MMTIGTGTAKDCLCFCFMSEERLAAKRHMVVINSRSRVESVTHILK